MRQYHFALFLTATTPAFGIVLKAKLGHLNPNFNLTSVLNCPATYQIAHGDTCGAVCADFGMSLSDFVEANPSLKCGSGIVLTPNTLVCVASAAGNSTSDSESASSSEAPLQQSFVGANVPAPSPATTTTAAPTSTTTNSTSSSVTTTIKSIGTTATVTLKTTTTSTISASPTTAVAAAAAIIQPHLSPSPIIEGTPSNDNPPAASPDFPTDCLSQLNYARAHYTAAPTLTWDPTLAIDCQPVSDFAATTETLLHFDVTGGVGGQILAGVGTCAEAYPLWVTQEYPSGGHYEIITSWVYTRVGCSVSSGSVGATVTLIIISTARASLIDECLLSYSIQLGDICYFVGGAVGLSMADLATLNPSIQCEDLPIGSIMCLQNASLGGPPSSFAQVNVTQGPTCSSFGPVTSTSSCFDILSTTGISLTSLSLWNTGLNCFGLEPNCSLCVGVGGGATSKATDPTSNATDLTSNATEPTSNATDPTFQAVIAVPGPQPVSGVAIDPYQSSDFDPAIPFNQSPSPGSGFNYVTSWHWFAGNSLDCDGSITADEYNMGFYAGSENIPADCGKTGTFEYKGNSVTVAFAWKTTGGTLYHELSAQAFARLIGSDLVVTPGMPSGVIQNAIECQLKDWAIHQTKCGNTSSPQQQKQESPTSPSTAQLASPPAPARRKRRKAGPRPIVSLTSDTLELDSETISELKYYLIQIYAIVKPVCVCIFFSVLWMKLTNPPTPYFDVGVGNLAPSLYAGGVSGVVAGGTTVTAGEQTADLTSALIIISQIIVATVIIYLLFRYNCMKILYGFFGLIVLGLLGMFGYVLGTSLLSIYNVPFDYISFVFFLWNVAGVGLVSIFWKGPLILQQWYMVLMSTLMALSLSQLPAITSWILLSLLAVWAGPTMMMASPPSAPPQNPFVQPANPPAQVQTEFLTHERQESEYTTQSMKTSVTRLTSVRKNHLGDSASVAEETVASSAPGSQPQLANPPTAAVAVAAAVEEEEDGGGSGMKLGLGDFVFYSVLSSRAALLDWVSTMSVIVAVITGLNFTIFLLVLFQKALPALPISIMFGLLFYFVSYLTLVPMVNQLTNMPDRLNMTAGMGGSALWAGRNGGAGLIYV
ncbi:Presenilin-1 [Podochytrium sp. JEL0797]|nr:Presenilin-1 [Podochytrium sp. JEL0797]